MRLGSRIHRWGGGAGRRGGGARRRCVGSLFLCCALFLFAALEPLTTAALGEPDLDSLQGFSDALEGLSTRISPSVVQILVAGYQAPPWASTTTAGLLSHRRSSASGVVLSADGYIVTNAHVVAGARRVQVLLPANPGTPADRRSILKADARPVGAQIVGIDRETDLAVLKVHAEGLDHLELGDSDDLRQGELVMAFGSPLGLENSVSFGVVSSVARQLRPEDPMIYVQTDAAINPGNSGGPLVNTRGEVVGINTMILSQSGGSEGIGFAAPSNIVRNIFDQIRNTGHVRRGQIGVRAQTITPNLAAGLELERSWGVLMSDVQPDGPADRAGLRIGDIVLTLDGKVMENGRQLEVNIYGRKVGERVTLEILRGAEKRSFRVEVTERSNDPRRLAAEVTPERNLIPALGILALDIDTRLARVLPPLRQRSGVVVAAMAADAPFWEGGFIAGDVIHALNGREITSLDRLRVALAALEPGDPVVVQIERQREMMFVDFALE